MVDQGVDHPGQAVRRALLSSLYRAADALRVRVHSHDASAHYQVAPRVMRAPGQRRDEHRLELGRQQILHLHFRISNFNIFQISNSDARLNPGVPSMQGQAHVDAHGTEFKFKRPNEARVVKPACMLWQDSQRHSTAERQCPEPLD